MRTNAICRRLMTVPGVGAMVALTFTSAIDDPARFTSSKSGRRAFWPDGQRNTSPARPSVTGGISRAGDAMARTALYEAAHNPC